MMANVCLVVEIPLFNSERTGILWFLKYSECNINVKTFTQEPMNHLLTKKKRAWEQGAMSSEMLKMTDKLNYVRRFYFSKADK